MSSPYNGGPQVSMGGDALPHSANAPGNIHPVHNWEVATVAALSTITPLYSTDVGKIAKVLAPENFYILADDDPATWQRISMAVDAPKITVSVTPPASPSLNDIWIQIP